MLDTQYLNKDIYKINVKTIHFFEIHSCNFLTRLEQMALLVLVARMLLFAQRPIGVVGIAEMEELCAGRKGAGASGIGTIPIVEFPAEQLPAAAAAGGLMTRLLVRLRRAAVSSGGSAAVMAPIPSVALAPAALFVTLPVVGSALLGGGLVGFGGRQQGCRARAEPLAPQHLDLA